MIKPFWNKSNKSPLVVEKTDKNFLRGVHKGEPIWKVSKGDEYLLIRQEEALQWEELLKHRPELAEEQKEEE